MWQPHSDKSPLQASSTVPSLARPPLSSSSLSSSPHGIVDSPMQQRFQDPNINQGISRQNDDPLLQGHVPRNEHLQGTAEDTQPIVERDQECYQHSDDYKMTAGLSLSMQQRHDHNAQQHPPSYTSHQPQWQLSHYSNGDQDHDHGLIKIPNTQITDAKADRPSPSAGIRTPLLSSSAASIPNSSTKRAAMVPLSSAVLVVEPCIAHIVIPQSHRELLRKTLENVPAPVWTIKKKSVRFKSAPMDAEESNSSSNAARREQACPVAYSTIKSKSSSSSDTSSSIKPGGSSSLSSSFLSSPTTSSAMCSNSVLALHSPSAVDKDPEEKMAELMELKQMKIRQGDFLHVKSQIFQIAQDLEDKNSILDEVRSERKALHSELSRYIGMVKQIQKDFAMAQEAEAQLIKERDQLSQHLTQLKQHDFKVLKEEVDLLRIRKGLRPLPSLEQEEAEFMGRYLEERRGQWREDGILQDGAGAEHSILANGGVGGSSGSHTAAVGSPYSVRSGSGHRPSSSSGSSPLYAAAASSSATTAISGASKSRSARVSASSSTSTLREKSKENRDGKGKGRDNSRGRERDRDRDRDMGSGERGRDKRRDDRWTQKTPTHSKDHNDGVKTSSAGTSGTGARRGRPSLSASIKTARQKNQSRSQSPPSAQTVSASESNDIARAERLKKRSRY